MTKQVTILLWLIVALMFIQIGITLNLSFTIKEATSLKQTSGQNSVLPEELSSEESRTKLFNELIGYYNEKNYDAIHNWLDVSIRDQQSKQKIVLTVDALHSMFGKILSGSYSVFIPIGEQNGIKGYELYYTVKAEKSVAKVKIIIMQQQNDKCKHYGFFILQ